LLVVVAVVVEARVVVAVAVIVLRLLERILEAAQAQNQELL
jgi:hypothetical protein